MPGRKFIVADIRGEIDLLKALMDKISPIEGDYFLFTGSYLGPGKDSKAVMDYIIDFGSKHSCNFLTGCYELLFQQVIAESKTQAGDFVLSCLRDLWKQMHGHRVLESYAKDTDISIVTENGKIQSITMPYVIPESHIRFLQKNLHLWYMDHDFPIVVFHAGPDMRNIQNPSPACAVAGANFGWWDSPWNLPGTTIVFSHTPFEKPFRKKGKIGIDLGAGIGGSSLCAYEMSSDEFVIARAA